METEAPKNILGISGLGSLRDVLQKKHWEALDYIKTLEANAKQLQSENAVLRELSDERGKEICRLWKTINETDGKLARLVEAAKLRLKSGHSDICSFLLSIAGCDCGHHALVNAIAAAESGKEEILSLQAAAENILFKRKHGVTIEDVDFEWLENATGENNA